MYRALKIIVLVAFIGFNIAPTSAQLLLSDQYKEGECELVAKEYQRVYGGSLIFIQPLKSNGEYDFGEYSGAWINKAWNRNRGVYYIDYMSGTYFNNTDEVLDWYTWNTLKKAEIFNVNEKHPPFELIWHY